MGVTSWCFPFPPCVLPSFLPSSFLFSVVVVVVVVVVRAEGRALSLVGRGDDQWRRRLKKKRAKRETAAIAIAHVDRVSFSVSSDPALLSR